MADYSDLTREDLEARLRAAEDVCLMFGWSPSRRGPDQTDREKAAHELWVKWIDLAGPDGTSPQQNRHLSDEYVTELAAQRDRIVEATLQRIRG